MDDGKFKLRTFGTEIREQSAIQENEFDVNKAIGINDFTMPNKGFADPFIVAQFIGKEKLFVALFHNHTMT
jgi:hypothetical protein